MQPHNASNTYECLAKCAVRRDAASTQLKAC